MWTAQGCAKLEPPALPLIPVAVLRPRLLITIPAEDGDADVGFVCRVSIKGAMTVNIVVSGKKGGRDNRCYKMNGARCNYRKSRQRLSLCSNMGIGAKRIVLMKDYL